MIWQDGCGHASPLFFNDFKIAAHIKQSGPSQTTGARKERQNKSSTNRMNNSLSGLSYNETVTNKFACV